MAVLAVGLMAVSCSSGGSSGAPVMTVDHRVGGLEVQSLNSIGGQRFDYSVAGDTITVRAPATNDKVTLKRFLDEGGGVIGEAFWKANQSLTTDQQVCVQLGSVMDVSTVAKALDILHDPTLRHLPGVALRVSPGVNGSATRAITVTQNMSQAAVWAFDVNFVRSDISGANAAAVVSHFVTLDFKDVVGRWTGTPDDNWKNLGTTMKPPPWNLCARVVGTKVSVMVWGPGEAQPSWSDAQHVQSVQIDAGLVYQGYAGGYEQGLSPGKSSKFIGLKVTSPY